MVLASFGVFGSLNNAECGETMGEGLVCFLSFFIGLWLMVFLFVVGIIYGAWSFVREYRAPIQISCVSTVLLTRAGMKFENECAAGLGVRATSFSQASSKLRQVRTELAQGLTRDPADLEATDNPVGSG